MVNILLTFLSFRWLEPKRSLHWELSTSGHWGSSLGQRWIQSKDRYVKKLFLFIELEYTVKPPYNVTPYNVIFNRTSIFEKHRFLPYYSLLKKPPYNMKNGLRDFNTMRLFTSHLSLFKNKIHPHTTWFFCPHEI